MRRAAEAQSLEQSISIGLHALDGGLAIGARLEVFRHLFDLFVSQRPQMKR